MADPNDATRPDAPHLSGADDAPCPPAEALDLLAAYRRVWLRSHPVAKGLDFPQPFGRFVLHGLLGRGGQGVVFRATDPDLNREVALKVPRPESLWTPAVRQRFLYEGQAAAVLDHPNVVTVFEAGELDGICYIAAAYCPGPTLAGWLSGHPGPVPVDVAVRLVAALADGVDHAHSRGVLHRDLKPANVLLSPGPETPRITDFGLARFTDGSGEANTRTGDLLGTPRYMAPEQAAGDTRRIGTHTDVYALGLILYELLTGANPFAGAEPTDALRLVVAGDVPRPRRNGRVLPRDLESVCLKCLETATERRYPTAGELAADLRRFLAGEPVLARPPGRWRGLVAWARRHPATAAFTAASLVAVVLFAGGAGWYSHQMGAKNDALRGALADADRQTALADARAEETRLVAYEGQVRLAGDLLRGGQPAMMSDVLDRLGPRPGELDHREFTWRLLWGHAGNDYRLRGHRIDVGAVAFDPAGRTLYSVAPDSTICEWATGDRWLRRTITHPDADRPCALAVSRDGRQIAVVVGIGIEEYRIRVYDVASGSPVASLACDRVLPRPSLVFLDGQTLAVNRNTTPGGEHGAVLLWNWQTGRRRLLLRGQGECTTLALSPDGRLLAASYVPIGSPTTRVQLISVPGGEVVGQLPEVRGQIEALAFAPDGCTLAGGGKDEAAVLWDVKSRTELRRAEPNGETVEAITFVESGRNVATFALVPGSPRFRCRVRDAATWDEVRDATEHTGDPDLVACDPTGEFFALPEGPTVRLVRHSPTPLSVRLPGHPAETWGVTFTPDSRSLLSSSDDSTVAVWDLAAQTRRHSLKGHGALASCVATTPVGGWAVSGSYDSTLIVWDVQSGGRLRTLSGHAAPVRAVAVSPDGTRIASAGRDRSTRLWDARTGRQLAVWEYGDVRAVAFTPDGTRLVTGGNDKRIVVRDLTTGTAVTFEHPCEVWCLAVTPDGKSVVAGGEDGVPRVWNLATGAGRALLGGHTSGIRGLAVSPDGRTLATGGMDRSVRLWHLPTAGVLCAFAGLSEAPLSVAFSPDGNTLAAGLYDGGVLVWRAPVLPLPR